MEMQISWEQRYSDLDNENVNNFLNDLTLSDVFLKYGIDIETDERNKLICNPYSHVVLTEPVLNWLGFKNGTYTRKKNRFTKLLAKNPRVKFTELDDPPKKYYTLSSFDFYNLLMQIQTPEADALRKLSSLSKRICAKYIEYQKRPKTYSSNSDVGYRVGLYKTRSNNGEYYVMRRKQKSAWPSAERMLLDRGLTRVKVWNNVSDAPSLMLRLYRQFFWLDVRGSTISVPENCRQRIKDNELTLMLESVILPSPATTTF